MVDVKKGFTLVELLVVVAILGVLAAVGIVSFGGFLGNAKENATKTNHSNVVSFIQTYWLKCTLEPKTYEDLVNSSKQKTSVDCVTENSWEHKFHNHFEGSGWVNPFNIVDRAVYMEYNDNIPSTLGQTNIRYFHNENKITIKTRWGTEENETISNTIYKEF